MLLLNHLPNRFSGGSRRFVPTLKVTITASDHVFQCLGARLHCVGQSYGVLFFSLFPSKQWEIMACPFPVVMSASVTICKNILHLFKAASTAPLKPASANAIMRKTSFSLSFLRLGVISSMMQL